MVNDKEYQVKKLISEGGYGYVYHVTHSKEDFALKRMILQEEDRVMAAKNEALNWSRLGNHPNIVEFVDS